MFFDCRVSMVSMEPKKKIEILREMMTAGNWLEAIKYASRFPRLPEKHRKTIMDGNEAIVRPAFQRALGKSTLDQIEAAKQALIEIYKL